MENLLAEMIIAQRWLNNLGLDAYQQWSTTIPLT